MDDVTMNNVDTTEVAPQYDDAQSSPVDATESASYSPSVGEDKEELLLGKFKSADDLAKSYKEAERELTRLRQAVADPEFIYQQALQMGLTEEEAQEQAEKAESRKQPTQSTKVRQPEQDIARIVDRQVAARLDYEKAVSIMPEIASDSELKAWAGSLVAQGKSHVEAVKTIQKRLGITAQEAKAQGAQAAQATITEKERAATATAPKYVDSGAQAEAKLQKDLHNPWDKKAQENALVEILKRQNKQAGRI